MRRTPDTGHPEEPIRRATRFRLRLFLFLALLGAGARAARAEAPSGLAVIDGRKAPALLGAAVPSIRVYAFHEREARAVPFQIDERDHRDRWVVDHGRKAGPDDTPDEIDENDALVVAIRDLGSRGDASALPPARRWLEMRVGESAAPRGWIYVGFFGDPPPLAEDPGYVRYDPESDRVFAERYAVGFDRPLPTHVAFVDRIGEWGTNRLEIVRAVGEARLFAGLVTLRRDESAIEEDFEGYRIGPVRVIRRAQYWIRLPLGFKARGRIALLFSRDAAAAEAVARIEIPPSLVPGDGELTAAFEFRDLDGARLIMEGLRADGVVDGHMSPLEKELDGRKGRWAALALPDGGAFLLGVDLEGALRRLDQRLHYHDGPYERPRFGFELSKVSRLETGEHPMTVTGMILADEKEIPYAARRLLADPEIDVRELPGGAEEADADQPTASVPRSSSASSSSAKR